MFIFYLFFNSIVFCALTQAQNNVNDSCVLENGNAGQCLSIDNCPTAVDLIRQNKGTPKTCGFVGKTPIICCQLQPELKQLNVGDISKQKCVEFYGIKSNLRRISKRSKMEPSGNNTSVEIATVVKPIVVHHVIGGEKVFLRDKFLHMAALGYEENNNIKWACGGSLISDKHILTAAHCIHTQHGEVKYVLLGDLNLKAPSFSNKLSIAKTIRHPGYKPPLVYNDIAIIELANIVKFNIFIRPGCLNTDFNLPTVPNQELIATGWGLTDFQGEPSDQLQEVSLRLYTFPQCQQAYASMSKRRLSNGIDNKTQICVGGAFKDTCQGDSGGPLQIENQNYRNGYTIIGITSFGKACGIGDTPSVYIRVSHYIDWIESIVWPNV